MSASLFSVGIACTGVPLRMTRSSLSRLRPDLEIVPIRGNVETRLRKVDAGEVDATLLASAGKTLTHQQIFATLYHNLGIDANKVTLNDLSGRPQYLVDNNYQPIRELI